MDWPVGSFSIGIELKAPKRRKHLALGRNKGSTMQRAERDCVVHEGKRKHRIW